jgi:hypothetical protein
MTGNSQLPDPPVLISPAPGARGVPIPSGAATVSWNPSARADRYDVRWGIGSLQNVTQTTATSVLLPNLNPQGTYLWRVDAVNSAGSASSGQRSFVTAALVQGKLGVFRPKPDDPPGLRQWFVDANASNGWDSGDLVFSFGLKNDRPVVGDWNGDGTLKAGIFRDKDEYGNNLPGEAQWYVDWNNNWTWDGNGTGDLFDRIYTFGLPPDTHLPPEFQERPYGDQPFYAPRQSGQLSGKIGVYRNGYWYFDCDGSGNWSAADEGCIGQFGLPGDPGDPGDKAVVGDWIGDGKIRIGVFRNVNGLGAWILDIDGNDRFDGSEPFFLNSGCQRRLCSEIGKRRPVNSEVVDRARVLDQRQAGNQAG